VLHHVADVHLNFYLRFHLALTDDNPTVPRVNPDAWAALPDVEATPVTVSLALLEALHTRLTLLLWALTERSGDAPFSTPPTRVPTPSTRPWPSAPGTAATTWGILSALGIEYCGAQDGPGWTGWEIKCSTSR
jgi:hypothetical protein